MGPGYLCLENEGIALVRDKVLLGLSQARVIDVLEGGLSGTNSNTDKGDLMSPLQGFASLDADADAEPAAEVAQ
jgi:hypothetical protein